MHLWARFLAWWCNPPSQVISEAGRPSIGWWVTLALALIGLVLSVLWVASLGHAG